MDKTLSESSVSLRLANIQKRCEDLMQKEENELRLEDADARPPGPSKDVFNPYNRSE